MTAFGSLPQRMLTCHAFNASRTWTSSSLATSIGLLRCADLVALSIDHVPAAAKLDRSLAFDLTSRMVAGVVVERMAVVGQLEGPIVPNGSCDQGLVQLRGQRRSARRTTRKEGWPRDGARAVAYGHVVSLDIKQVQGAAGAIDDDLAVARVGYRNCDLGGSCRARGCWACPD